MTDLPEMVKRATGIHGAIASDLVLSGGILRCSSCGGERPLGQEGIASYLSSGWPEHCGSTMRWVTLREAAHEQWGPVPEGFELVAVADEGWRVEAGRPCRRKTGGREACGRPSVASLNRGRATKHGTVPAWWAYCADHLYGHWIQDGAVMRWILREKAGA